MKIWLAVLLVTVFVLIPAGTPCAGTLEVVEVTFCTGVEERTPVGADTEFSNTVGRVWCFTKITGADDPTTVVHVWYFNDEEKARVDLAVNSNSWRTWSSKQVVETWTGQWRLEVESADGTVLKTAEFAIKLAAQAPE